MLITWRGHSCFEIEEGDRTFVIDPFLDGSDVSVQGLDPDVVLVTHGHGDHVGAAAEFDAPVVAIPEVAHALEKEGCDTVDMNIGGTVSFGDVAVHMTMAMHSSSTGGYERYGGMPAGYVVEGETGSVYHAGDTSLFVDMRETIARMLQPDVALLPIGDHYTMGPESSAVAAEWLGVDVAVPMHFDTFPPVEQDPAEFVNLLPDTVEGVVLESGETLRYGEA